MLDKCIHIEHKANNLHRYFANYLQKIKNLPKGTSFVKEHCPDEDLAIPFSKMEDGKPTKLHSLVISFQKSFLDLEKKDREIFLKIFKDTNNISILFKKPTTAVRKNKYPGKTGSATHKLLVEMYSNTFDLVAFNIKEHYQIVYDTKKHSWCPFCGMEKYKVPEHQKEDYDHLLSKKDYPVAAVNLSNLIPMGDDCNRLYKKDDDILLDKKTKKSRQAVDPYSEVIKPILSLKGSVIDVDPVKRKWQVSFKPKTQKVSTWNDLFDIERRCKDDYLVKRTNSTQEPEYDTQIEFLVKICRGEKESQERILKKKIIWELSDLNDHLSYWIDAWQDYYYQDRNMLRSAVYQFLKDHCDKGYKEILLTRINSSLKKK